MKHYSSGFGFPQDVIFDQARAERLMSKKWVFVGTRGDVSTPREFFNFQIFDEQYFLLHGTDGVIRCMVNRCSHQSARLLKKDTGKCPASIICPNHQWAFSINDGSVRNAPGFGKDYPCSVDGKSRGLTQIPVAEIGGLLFVCLSDDPDQADASEISDIISPYVDPYGLQKGGYKRAHHERVVVDASWLLVMMNNRECCHCTNNHKGLTQIFDPVSFNGAQSDTYKVLFDRAVERWEAQGLLWEEQAFKGNDCTRVARYPLFETHKSITFDGAPASKKLIGPFEDYDQSSLSIWFNPNAWLHFASDHITANWVLPAGPDKSILYTSWLVHEDAVEGEDYDLDHLTEVWRVTNGEDIELTVSMTEGAMSRHHRPGPFAPDERYCVQFCDWYMKHSS